MTMNNDKEGIFVNDNVQEIDWLPSQDELGNWAMPDDRRMINFSI